MVQKILFIAPHPDDETIGCGGTILKHRDQGDEIYWLIVTSIDENNGWKLDEKEIRLKQIEQVASAYKFQGVFNLGLPTRKLDYIPFVTIVEKMAEALYTVKPHIVYVPNRYDVHTDHQVTFKATMSVTKNFRAPFIQKILMYECLSETEFAPPFTVNSFIPNVFINITNSIDEKMAILNFYSLDIMAAPFPRSIEVIKSLAKYRGSSIGKHYAESFMLIKEIL